LTLLQDSVFNDYFVPHYPLPPKKRVAGQKNGAVYRLAGSGFLPHFLKPLLKGDKIVLHGGSVGEHEGMPVRTLGQRHRAIED